MRSKITIFANLAMIFLVITCSTTSQAATPAWDIGTMYTIGIRDSVYIKNENLEDGTFGEDSITLEQIIFINITNDDNASDTIYYDVFSPSSVSSQSSNYNATDYANNLVLSNILSVNYEFDLLTNETRLESFDFDLSTPGPFLEPNWAVINTKLKDELNESTLIDTVDDPYDPITYNITFGDLLNSLPSYKIQGESTLSAAKSLMTNTTSLWTFEFDLTGVLNFEYYNDTFGDDVYIPCDSSTYYNYELGFNSDGIMDIYGYCYQIVETDPEYRYTEREQLKLKLGGLPTEEGTFAYLALIPAFMIAVIIRIKTKKK
jgi:hypothetical protein